METRHPPSLVTCAVCGFTFDPLEHPGCASCPLHSGCPTACCPNCGAQNIDPRRSTLARLVERLLSRKPHETNFEKNA